MALSRWFGILCVVCTVAVVVNGDTPANCSFQEIVGKWQFHIGEKGHDNSIDCHSFVPVTQYDVTLYFPDLAVDDSGNQGFWTLIYNQGFEVVIKHTKFFAFSKFRNESGKIVSECFATSSGWMHDDDGHNWACYVGSKVGSGPGRPPVSPQLGARNLEKRYIPNQEFVDAINEEQKSWHADVYWEDGERTHEELIRRAGGRASVRAYPRTAPLGHSVRIAAAALPKELDWRNMGGVNFVSPVRNQESCGSCYAFGSMAMYEARQRIMTNNSVQLVFSTQDIVSCSQYAQGCEGGFPYLIAGKYGQDFGLVEESCYPYTARDDKCKPTTCRKYYTRDYYYVGGYYGACNEQLMRIEIAKNGPIAISFEVYPDFPKYKGGIYVHTTLEDKFNPWEITNHVVLIVGYGEDQSSGVKFWIVKNSWGAKWGESGYFRIRRGTDECSIESMAVGIHPTL